jgi:hypothetical protein
MRFLTDPVRAALRDEIAAEKENLLVLAGLLGSKLPQRASDFAHRLYQRFYGRLR